MKKIKIGLPLRLIIIIALAFLFGDLLPVTVKSFAYGISLTLKDCLVFVMPIIIFAYIFSCLVSFKDNSIKFLASLLGSVCLSNFISAMIAFGVSYYVFHASQVLLTTHTASSIELSPLFEIKIPELISNNFALFGGIIIGLICSFVRSDIKANHIIPFSEKLKNLANFILNKLFIPVLPLFILGFILKMHHEGELKSALGDYGPVVLIFASCQIVYIVFLYGLAANFNPRRWVFFLRNVSASILTGFTTMSSLAALPLNIRSAAQNTNNNPMVGVIAPATVNIHLVGDSIAIPTLALAIIANNSMLFPDFSIYLIFAFYFVMNKFAVAAVPGGGILVMIPILHNYLGFTDEMLSLITILYVLFDPIITSVNVAGNGAFAILFTKIFGRRKEEVVPEVIPEVGEMEEELLVESTHLQ